jgi:hypothetical protein
MKSNSIPNFPFTFSLILVASLALSGCATTEGGGNSATSSATPSRYRATDGRTIDIGKSTPAEGGTRYNNPHMEKGKCWVADGFKFEEYDTIYVAPTVSTAKFPDKEEDQMVHRLAKERLVSGIAKLLRERNVAPHVVTVESEIASGAKVLRLENTITEFSKGGGAARYFVGLYGGGQPVLRVQGRLMDHEKMMFSYEAMRTGTSGDARVGGAFMKDEDIQVQDIHSLAVDLTDFLAAVAGNYEPKR